MSIHWLWGCKQRLVRSTASLALPKGSEIHLPVLQTLHNGHISFFCFFLCHRWKQKCWNNMLWVYRSYGTWKTAPCHFHIFVGLHLCCLLWAVGTSHTESAGFIVWVFNLCSVDTMLEGQQSLWSLFCFMLKHLFVVTVWVILMNERLFRYFFWSVCCGSDCGRFAGIFTALNPVNISSAHAHTRACLCLTPQPENDSPCFCRVEIVLINALLTSLFLLWTFQKLHQNTEEEPPPEYHHQLLSLLCLTLGRVLLSLPGSEGYGDTWSLQGLLFLTKKRSSHCYSLYLK